MEAIRHEIGLEQAARGVTRQESGSSSGMDEKGINVVAPKV